MKIGFIGTGNMGGAIIKGIVTAKFISGNEINIFDPNNAKVRELVEKYNANSLQDEISTVENSDIIILCVKPNIYNSVLKKIKDSIAKNKIIVSIAAGINIDSIENKKQFNEC